MGRFITCLKNSEKFYGGNGVSPEIIENAESELLLKFSEEYKEYLLCFGSASIYGHEFTGLGIDGPLNVIDATRYDHSKNPSIPNDLYVVEELHIDDVVMWQKQSGEIYQSFGDGSFEKKYDSLYEYIKENSEDEPAKEKKRCRIFRFLTKKK